MTKTHILIIIGIISRIVGAVVNEARECTSSGAYTTAVLASRKLFMHFAVEREAEENKSFA